MALAIYFAQNRKKNKQKSVVLEYKTLTDVRDAFIFGFVHFTYYLQNLQIEKNCFYNGHFKVEETT